MDLRAVREHPTERLFQNVGRRGPRTLVVALASAAIVIGSAAAGHRLGSTSTSAAPPPITGTVEIETSPPGAYVVIDGRPRGRTPLRLTLSAGPHGVELSSEGRTKTVPLRVTAGSHTMQFIELPSPAGSSEVHAAPGADALEPGRLD